MFQPFEFQYCLALIGLCVYNSTRVTRWCIEVIVLLVEAKEKIKQVIVLQHKKKTLTLFQYTCGNRIKLVLFYVCICFI